MNCKLMVLLLAAASMGAAGCVAREPQSARETGAVVRLSMDDVVALDNSHTLVACEDDILDRAFRDPVPQEARDSFVCFIVEESAADASSSFYQGFTGGLRRAGWVIESAAGPKAVYVKRGRRLEVIGVGPTSGYPHLAPDFKEARYMITVTAI